MKLTKLLQRVCSLAVVASVVLLGVSCSQDDSFQASTDNLQSKEIKFKASTSEPETRANIINSSSDISKFSVWAYKTDSSYYIGDRNGTGENVSKVNNVWTPSSRHLWPTDTLNFYALAYKSPELNNVSRNGENLTYTVPTNSVSQEDIMTAHSDKQTQDLNNGVVSLNFKHALVELNYVLSLSGTDADGISVEVRNITFHGLKNKLTLNLLKGTSKTDENSYDDFSFPFSSGNVILDNKKSSDKDTKNIILTVPQVINTLQSNSKFYIEVEFRAKKGDKYLKGSKTEFVKSKLELNTNTKLESGRQYVFNIDFSNEFKTITTSVTVADWVNVYKVGPFGHHAVDLGLPSGTCWANINIGGEYTDERDKYSFGDINAWHRNYDYDISWDSQYVWGSDTTSLTKYCSNTVHGKVDNKKELDPEDDPAYVNWGSKWRTPSWADWLELIHNCTWVYTTENGVKGWEVTGPNGNAIFLSADGNGFYGNIGYGEMMSYGTRELADDLHYRCLYIWNGHTMKEWFKDEKLLEFNSSTYNLDANGEFVPQSLQRWYTATIRPVCYK